MRVVLTSVEALEAEINDTANRQFETPEFRAFFEPRLTLARARLIAINMGHYVMNRRDCWGFVQGAVPLDVKRLVWEHEQEELVFDPRAGMDHFTLTTKEAAVLGLTPEDFQTTPPVAGAQASFYAWIHLAKSRPWLEAITASCVLEIRNSSAVIRGGGASERLRRKLVDELGIPQSELINQSVHVEADMAHATMLRQVMDRYATTDEARAAILRGARDSFIVDRAFRGAVGYALADLN
jgi:pyrroloquinoline quinone (PQQ) biosynthesis protein C